jgi:predicted GIY-YIG superfamily endonuclease
MSNKLNRQGWVYVLRLEHDCWYVGHTKNLRDRIRDHFVKGMRTKWTSLHTPIALQMFAVAPISMERCVTEDLAALFGIDKVRGAYPLLSPTPSDELLAQVPTSPFIFNDGPSHAGCEAPLSLVMGSWSQLRF